MKKFFFLFLVFFYNILFFARMNYYAATVQNVTGTYIDLSNPGTAITTNFNGGDMTFDNNNSSIQKAPGSEGCMIFWYQTLSYTSK